MSNTQDAVIIVEYDPQWPALYEQERAQLAQVLGGLAVGFEHMGSTAVPGLAAKPLIDIMVLVEKMAGPEVYAGPLQSLGYWSPIIYKDHIFTLKGQPRTHHIHIFEQGSYEHLRHLAFRNYLRTHHEVAQEYSALKRQLAEKYKLDRDNYTESKTGFIKALEILALQEFYPDYHKREEED